MLRKLANTITRAPPPPARLAYLDFGLVADVPLQVREALVCAVALLLFDRDIAAVRHRAESPIVHPPHHLTSYR